MKEIDLEAAQPVKLTADEVTPAGTVEFFEKPILDPEKLAELQEPHEKTLLAEDFHVLTYKDLCPEQAEQFYVADRQEKKWKEIRKALRDETETLAKERRGNLPYGDYILEIEKSPGKTTIDWEEVAKQHMTEADYKSLLKDKELVKAGKMTHKWITKGEDGVKIGVDKIQK